MSGVAQSIFSALAAKFTRGGATRQIFLCAGPDCCKPEQGEASFKALNEAVAQFVGNESGDSIRCVKTGCLGVCGRGPIAIVYPEKTWYREMTQERVRRVAREHLAEGHPVAEFTFNPPPEAKPPIR